MEIVAKIWRPVLEILILWLGFYWILLFFKGSRAFQLLKGIILLVIAFFLFQVLGLVTLSWILTKLFAISVIAILILFQPELRRGLARLGQSHLFHFGLREEDIEKVVQEISTACSMLSKKRIGALIAIKRESGLEQYIESGIQLDSLLTAELLQSIFVSLSPLHDGGVVIEGIRIVAASCLYPLYEGSELKKALGTRHRAGLGLSQESDAIVIIVSAETGIVSLAVHGRMTRELSKEDLQVILRGLLKKEKR